MKNQRSWINENGAYIGVVRCSECGEEEFSTHAFCWRCGTEVREEEEFRLPEVEFPQ